MKGPILPKRDLLVPIVEHILPKRGRRVFGLAEDLPDAILRLVKHTRMQRRHKRLDAELKNWKP